MKRKPVSQQTNNVLRSLLRRLGIEAPFELVLSELFVGTERLQALVHDAAVLPAAKDDHEPLFLAALNKVFDFLVTLLSALTQEVVVENLPSMARNTTSCLAPPQPPTPRTARTSSSWFECFRVMRDERNSPLWSPLFVAMVKCGGKRHGSRLLRFASVTRARHARL